MIYYIDVMGDMGFMDDICDIGDFNDNGLLGFTWCTRVHLVSLGFTWDHVGSRWFTCLGFT